MDHLLILQQVDAIDYCVGKMGAALSEVPGGSQRNGAKLWIRIQTVSAEPVIGKLMEGSECRRSWPDATYGRYKRIFRPANPVLPCT